MSRVEFHAEKNRDAFEIVKYRIRRANEWCNHRIAMSRRAVVKGAVFQDFQRWHYSDDGSLVNIDLTVELNCLENKI